jgi:hypothetical protein
MKEQKIEVFKSGKIISNPGNKVVVDLELEILGTDTSLPIIINADFSNIPVNLRQKYVGLFQEQYLKDINIHYKSN